MLRVGNLEFATPAVMGVLNVTPDSFSDGGRHKTLESAVRHAEQMLAEGATLIDVGGESTRPGAIEVSEAEELERVIPVIEAIRSRLDVGISVDTGKPGVMREALAAGACMINDVYALRLPGALTAAAELACPVCLMHMQGAPRTMQLDPHYADVVAEVTEFLRERVAECERAGIDPKRIIVDPGFGFGKTAAHNVELLANLRALGVLGRPVMIGVSRKATLGVLTGRDVAERLAGGLAAAVLAVMQGAQIVRTHDVAATVDALAVASAVTEAGKDQ